MKRGTVELIFLNYSFESVGIAACKSAAEVRSTGETECKKN
jgi:hypothetical protein